jgi:hypothetical protein
MGGRPGGNGSCCDHDGRTVGGGKRSLEGFPLHLKRAYMELMGTGGNDVINLFQFSRLIAGIENVRERIFHLFWDDDVSTVWV